MKLLKLIIFLGSTIYLLGCSEATVVLDCAKPQSLKTISGLKLGGKISVKKAQGAIDASIGKELKADFASSDLDKWSSIVSRYQYQMCQLINSSSCGDLKKDKCLTKKLGMLNDTFDKITAQLNAEKEKQTAIEEEQLKVKVGSCVAGKVSEYQIHKDTSTEGGARAKAPGIKGGRNTDTQNVCYNVGSNQKIVSAETTSPLSCYGRRCSVTAVSFQNNDTRVCVTTKAWSESKSLGAGGSAKYKLKVVYYDVATTAIVDRFRSTCAAESS